MSSTRWMRTAAVAVAVPLFAVVVPAPAPALAEPDPGPARAEPDPDPDPDKLKVAGYKLVAKTPVRGIRQPAGSPATTPATVKLTQTCAPPAIPVKGTTTCTVTAENTGFTPAVTDLTSATLPPLMFTGATGAKVTTPLSVKAPRVTLAAAKPAGPSAVTADEGALFGYIPLAAFGAPARAIGDEEIIELDVPAFLFNGTTYSKIGISSNGYLVAGGGTAADVAPTGNLPDPARPNNVIAPFWTDLDGTGTAGVLAEVLTDGVSDWLVVEWQGNVKGTTSPRVFQVWIGVNGVQDITFGYNWDTISDPGKPLTVGAENAGGIVGARLPAGTLPTTDLRVLSAGPQPGGTVSYTVTLKGLTRGAGKLVSTAKVQGTTKPVTATTTVTVQR
ncbi:hypothetical protein AB0M02_24710 [Actinoplanes sp. NPDC051861]|uniref:hypothetical protein n=1 Tax=Actinoplanes sp. NPDC051861 TaxID=3155170 RepID=UPI003437DC3C